MSKRIVKKPDVRRLEIIQAAKKLFELNGYAKTSVEAIIEKAGIAKGTFYYYFKSKKNILSAIVEQIGSEMENYFIAVAQQDDLRALAKLQKMIRGPEKKVKTDSPIMELIHKPENRELQEQLNIQSVEIIAPLIAMVLEQGYQEGVFPSLVAVETVQLILAGSQFVLSSGLFSWSPQKHIVFLKELQRILEKLTGVKPGLLRFISEE